MLIQVTSAISECSFQDWSPKLTIYHKLLFSRPKSKVYEITSWSPHNPDAGIKSKLKVDYLWNHNPDAGIKFDAVSSKYLPRQFYNLSPCLSQTSWSCQFCKLLSWKLESNCNAIACFTGISREYTSHVTTLQGYSPAQWCNKKQNNHRIIRYLPNNYFH